jgi:hypothetical protein
MVKKALGKIGEVNKNKLLVSITVATLTTMLLAVNVSADPFADGAADNGALVFVQGMLGILRIILVGIGGGLGVWGVVNLLEGYGNDNAGAKSQGMKQLMAGVGIALVGVLGVPLLDTFVSGWF